VADLRKANPIADEAIVDLRATVNVVFFAATALK
jgi:hypothetical protein